jgi:hypothetical protein
VVSRPEYSEIDMDFINGTSEVSLPIPRLAMMDDRKYVGSASFDK